jgi:hypothetical protein
MSLDPAPGVQASWCGGWGLPCAVCACIEARLARCCSWLCRIDAAGIEPRRGRITLGSALNYVTVHTIDGRWLYMVWDA